MNSRTSKKRISKTDRITMQVSAKFRTFGGGNATQGNPLAHALKDRQTTFAACVDVREVVQFVLRRANQRSSKKRK